MKTDDKKDLAGHAVAKPEQHAAQTKQTSGDKNFDNAIDRMLKKPVYQAPAK